jgi:hypothetical protein
MRSFAPFTARRHFLQAAAATLAGCALPLDALAARAPLTFAGRRWAVKQTSGGPAVGPGPNHFGTLARVDSDGSLLMRIARARGGWACSEVVLQQSLGYGSYEFDIELPPGGLDANVVMGMFLWSDRPAQHHREIDLEIARWGQPELDTDSQFVVQPHGTAGNLQRLSLQGAVRRRMSFTWSPGKVVFRARGDADDRQHTWTCDSPDVPTPGDETVRINLWLHEGRPPLDGKPVDVRVRDFRFTQRHLD